MAYQTFQEFNRTGIAGLFLYPASVVSLFIPLILFALFTITLLATYFSQRRLTGRGSFTASFAIAGYLTAVTSIVMSLIPGLINNYTMVVCVAVAVVATLILLISKN